MSEQVESSPAPPAEILPAKSEDKLEIEKEESQHNDAPEDSAEDSKPKPEEDKGESDSEKPKDNEEEKEKPADKKEEDAKEEEEDKGAEEKEEGAKKKFKMPKVELKTPKVPGFLRSKSKERKKVGSMFFPIYRFFLSLTHTTPIVQI